MCGRPHQMTVPFAAFGRRFDPARPVADAPPLPPDAQAGSRKSADLGGIGTRHPTRAGDAERRATDAVLAQAMSLGYLTFDEWQARTEQVLDATTTTELAAVTADLPVAELRHRDPAAVSSRAAAARRDIRTSTVGWLALAALMITIWLAVAIPTGAWYPWPIWPILGTGIGLVSHVVPARAALRSS